MKKNRNGRNWYAELCPAGATSWVRAVLICAVLITFLGGPILSADAEEAADGSEQTEESDASMNSDDDADAEEAASATGSAERDVAVSGTDEDSITQEASENGVYVSKSLIDNGDGTLQVELENYVTGQTYTGNSPADIILLLDVSSSMGEELTSESTRSEALQAAAIDFIDAVVERNSGLDSEYQNRIAIVSYSTLANIQCGFTLATSDTRDSLCGYINNLSFFGSTRMDRAFSTIQSDLLSEDAEDSRDQIIVFFTDGYPTGEDIYGTYHSGFVKAAANRTLVLAQALKSAGVQIYCISIHPLASSDFTELPEYEEIEEDYYFTQLDEDAGNKGTINTTPENAALLANRFMYLLSSYNPDATSVDDDGVTYSEDGTVYYYTADTVSNLVSVFTAIADSVGTAYTELDAGTEVIDYITRDFTLADSEEIRVYTSDYLGNSTWDDRVDITDQVTITSSSNCVRVSGFDYSSNYVSETAHPGTDSFYGCKLIVSFVILPSDTFGGNGMETNESASGIYPYGSDDPFVSYPVPAADVELIYEIGAADSIIYVPDSCTLSDLISYTDEYEPDGVRNAHVVIVYTMTDEDGSTVGTLTIPAGSAASDCSWEWVTEETSVCGTYSISCTVTPTDSGTYDSISRAAEASVHVLYPSLTLQDTSQQYGDIADIAEGDHLSETGLGDHFVSLDWICSEGLTSEELSAYDAPQLGYRVAYTEGVELEEEDYVICTTGDVPVVVGVYRVSDDALAVDITSYAEFCHACSRSGCGYDEETYGSLGVRCLIHVETDEESSEPEEGEPSAPGEEVPKEEIPKGGDTPGNTQPQASVPEDTADVSVTVTSTSTSSSSAEVSSSSSEEDSADASAQTAVSETADASIAGTADEDTSASGAVHSVSQTGDDAQWLFWAFTAAAAALAIALCLIFRRFGKRRS